MQIPTKICGRSVEVRIDSVPDASWAGGLTIPYLPSLETARGLIRGEKRLGGPLNRTELGPGLRLTVPVLGGSGALKRLPPEALGISQHGRWQHVHAGALEARLGRTPFWRHLEPSVVPLILGASGNLSELNRALWEALADFLDLGSNLRCLAEMEVRNPERIGAIRTRLARGTDPSLTVLNTIATLGRDAIFIL